MNLFMTNIRKSRTAAKPDCRATRWNLPTFGKCRYDTKDTKKSDRCKTSGYLLIRYADGVMPVWLRKYLPKNDWLGKLRQ